MMGEARGKEEEEDYIMLVHIIDNLPCIQLVPLKPGRHSQR